MNEFMEVFKTAGLLSNKLLKEIERNATMSTYTKGDLIQAIGQPVDGLILIERGLAMSCMYEEGRKKVDWFRKENEFIILVLGLVSEKYCRMIEIEALEDTVVWSWPARIIKSLQRRSADFNLYYAVITMKHILRVDEHHFNDREESLEKYYAFLRQREPDLLSRVPPKDLASLMKISEKELRDLANG